MNSHDDPQFTFHYMTDIANNMSDRGWRNNKTIEQFTGEIINEYFDHHQNDRFPVVIGVSLITRLKEIENSIYKINDLIVSIYGQIELRRVRKESVRLSDPMADAYRDWLVYGPESCATIDLDYVSIRLRNILESEELFCVADLIQYGESGLREIRQVGDLTIKEIRNYLREKHGLELGD